MNSPKSKSDRLLLWIIIVLSVAGNIYFAYRAISDNTRTTQDNPFEYNIDSFKQFDPELLKYSEVNQVPLCFQNVYGVAVDMDDNMYVTGDGAVLKMDSTGKLQSTFATGETALCLDIDGNGDIYLGMAGHIEIYDRDGAKLAQWESLGENAMITSVSVTDDLVFVADADSRVVRKYDKSGKMLLIIAEKDASKDIPGCVIPGRFFDVKTDPDGFLWVVNPGRHSLENYTFEGDMRTSWGEYSMEIEDFCGCCNPSHIAFLDDGRFVTSEKGIPRVKVYDRHGMLESVVAGPDQFADGTEGLDLAVDSTGRIIVLDPKKMSVRIFTRNIPGV